jgi:hypothetical protein
MKDSSSDCRLSTAKFSSELGCEVLAEDGGSVANDHLREIANAANTTESRDKVSVEVGGLVGQWAVIPWRGTDSKRGSIKKARPFCCIKYEQNATDSRDQVSAEVGGSMGSDSLERYK